MDLHDFTGRDGGMPSSPVTLDANGNLYGATEYGGTSNNCQLGCGVVWEITGVGAPLVVSSQWSETVSDQRLNVKCQLPSREAGLVASCD